MAGRRHAPSIDQAEIERFSRLAADWWDPRGPMRDGDAANRRYRAGKNGRLIVSPCPSPSPMQGYWNERIGIGEKFAASARHPMAHHWCKVEPAAVFEAVYQGAGDIVVAGDGTSPVISRRTGDRFHRQQTGPRVKSKWNTQSHVGHELHEIILLGLR